MTDKLVFILQFHIVDNFFYSQIIQIYTNHEFLNGYFDPKK